MRNKTEVTVDVAKPFSSARGGLLVLLTIGYMILLARGRYPWLMILDTVTANMFSSWQVFILIVTLVVWPTAIIGLILTAVWGTGVSTWRFRDLGIVEASLALLAFCCDFASFWLYESLIGLTIDQLDAYSRIYAIIGRIVQVVACLVALLWLMIRLKAWAVRHRVHREAGL